MAVAIVKVKAGLQNPEQRIRRIPPPWYSTVDVIVVCQGTVRYLWTSNAGEEIFELNRRAVLCDL